MNEEWETLFYKLIDEDYDIEDLVGVCKTARRNGFVAGIEKGKQQSTWVSVKDRLPNEDEIVLCRMKSNGAIVSGYIFISPEGYACVSTSPNFEFEDYGGYECDMWMPIPKYND